MKYYAEHEIAYQRLNAKGSFGWGDKKSIADLLSIPYGPELELAARRLPRQAKILDLGCGTGPISLFLGARGFQMTGVDISPSAIGKAQELSRELGIDADYICGDFLELQLPSESFDAVVDSSFLHCIVFDEDRLRTLHKIRESLRPGGLFLVHTMTADRAFDFGPEFSVSDDGVLWYLSKESRVDEARAHGALRASPQRRILPSQRVHAELSEQDFEELQSMQMYFAPSANPVSLFAVYRRR